MFSGRGVALGNRSQGVAIYRVEVYDRPRVDSRVEIALAARYNAVWAPFAYRVKEILDVEVTGVIVHSGRKHLQIAGIRSPRVIARHGFVTGAGLCVRKL
ncbi:hypothetical protein Ais01nite_34240 [Asanoa ishikariensis]|nr:hypothetical protein Ais01nite_34240 [Asanoa ishikariensis]